MAEASAESLQIAGLTRLSSCDWPGKLVATVFLQGCPLACGYCHNPGILDPRVPGTVQWGDVVEFLTRRRGLLDGVVFSGGEPTRQAGLATAMREVRELGFGVGLHTAGPYPRRFAAVAPLCDWIGLDIKAPARLYGAVTGVASAADRAFACLQIALHCGAELQVRTTVDPTTLTGDDVTELTATLRGLGGTDPARQQARAEGARPDYVEKLHAVLNVPAPSLPGPRRRSVLAWEAKEGTAPWPQSPSKSPPNQDSPPSPPTAVARAGTPTKKRSCSTLGRSLPRSATPPFLVRSAPSPPGRRGPHPS